MCQTPLSSFQASALVFPWTPLTCMLMCFRWEMGLWQMGQVAPGDQWECLVSGASASHPPSSTESDVRWPRLAWVCLINRERVDQIPMLIRYNATSRIWSGV